jgi:phage shock protein A
MGIFSRLAQLIKSNLNDLISKSEDPEKMLNQVVLDMNTQLVEAKKQVASSIADEKRLAKQAEQEQANANEWERRAMMALRAGNEELAKQALNRKKEHDELSKTYKDQWSKQKAAVDSLKRALSMLNDKIEEAKRKKNVLIARKKRAEAQKSIQETMHGLRVRAPSRRSIAWRPRSIRWRPRPRPRGSSPRSTAATSWPASSASSNARTAPTRTSSR